MAVVKLPVAGKVDQKVVLAGGAAVVGIVGYAWLSRGRTPAEPEVVPIADAPVTDYTPPTVLNSNGSFGGSTNPPVPGAAQSNTEWMTQAMEQGASLGFSTELLNSALQKYLAKQRMTPTEILAVTSIIAIIGTPPSNGPFPILPTLGPPPVENPHEGETLSAPPGFNPKGISPTQVVLQWNRVAGAVSYEVRRDNAGWSNVNAVERIVVPAPNDYQVHTYQVRAIDGKGKPGTPATGSAATVTQAQVNQSLYDYAHGGK